MFFTIAALVAAIAPAVFNLVQLKHGPSTPAKPDVGAVKMNDAATLIQGVLKLFAGNGLVPNELPDPKTLLAMLETLYQQVKTQIPAKQPSLSGFGVGSVLTIEVKSLQ